jgi:hypothetical protein
LEEAFTTETQRTQRLRRVSPPQRRDLEMWKFVGPSLIILLALTTATTGQQRFAKYRKIEAYEVRPGILMIPRYTTDGEVCEIGLEKLHYSPEMATVDCSLSRKDLTEILDELVPPDERGRPSNDVTGSVVTEGGNGMITSLDFENVSIQIFGDVLSSDHKGQTRVQEVLATAKWKKRRCS